MRSKTKVSLVSLAIAVCLMGTACQAKPQSEQKDDGAAADEVVEVVQEKAIGLGDEDFGKLRHESISANIAYNQTIHKPVVETLSDGTKVQRTPQDTGIYNVYTLKSDERGCLSCHTDLNRLLQTMPETTFAGADIWTYASPHLNLDFYGEAELEYKHCIGCHVGQYPSQGYWASLTTAMHGFHNAENEEFVAQGGDCMSCHVVTADGRMGMWDVEKYSVFRGILTADANAGSFEFDHDTLSEGDVFSTSWVQGDPSSTPYAVELGRIDGQNEIDPAEFESFEITIRGDAVTETVVTLGELIEKVPSVKDIVAFECVENPRNGSMIRNIEITGLPLKDVIALANPTADAKYVCVGDYPDEYAHDLFFDVAEMDTRDAWLIYEINGERLDYHEGYPVMCGGEGHIAGVFVKRSALIEVTTDHEQAESLAEISSPSYWAPSQAIFNTVEGEYIKAGQPYTFEGYAHGMKFAIDKIEFSLDMGQTWASFEIADGVVGPWTYWRYTWTPETPGAYVLQVRAIDSNGVATLMPAEVLVNVE